MKRAIIGIGNIGKRLSAALARAGHDATAYDDAALGKAHTADLSTWIDAVGEYATDVLRRENGEFYGFGYARPKNAEMVGKCLFSYR